MSFKKFLYKTGVKVKDNAPAIYMVAGIGGFIATVVLACHETTKAHEIIEEHKESMREINETKATTSEDEYSETDVKKDKVIVLTQTAVSFTKLYAPSVIVGALSILSFLRSYNLLKTRYLAASALAASLSEAFNKYRERVRSEYGEDVDNHLYFGTEYADVEYVNDKGKKVKDKIEVLPEGASIPPYAKFFDEACTQWNKSPEMNLMFLKAIENRMNDRFKAQGHLLLNQVYRALDIPETELGSEVGWFESHGDQFVDFGIFNGDDERKRAFVNGYEPSILLAFNCVPKFEGDLPKF